MNNVEQYGVDLLKLKNVEARVEVAEKELKETQNHFVEKYRKYKPGDMLVHEHKWQFGGDDAWNVDKKHYIIVDTFYEDSKIFYVYAVFTKDFARQSKKEPFLYASAFKLIDDDITIKVTGTTDIKNIKHLDLLLNEFYARVKKHYGFSAWIEADGNLRKAKEDK